MPSAISGVREPFGRWYWRSASALACVRIVSAVMHLGGIRGTSMANVCITHVYKRGIMWKCAAWSNQGAHKSPLHTRAKSARQSPSSSSLREAAKKNPAPWAKCRLALEEAAAAVCGEKRKRRHWPREAYIENKEMKVRKEARRAEAINVLFGA